MFFFDYLVSHFISRRWPQSGSHDSLFQPHIPHHQQATIFTLHGAPLDCRSNLKTPPCNKMQFSPTKHAIYLPKKYQLGETEIFWWNLHSDIHCQLDDDPTEIENWVKMSCNFFLFLKKNMKSAVKLSVEEVPPLDQTNRIKTDRCASPKFRFSVRKMGDCSL